MNLKFKKSAVLLLAFVFSAISLCTVGFAEGGTYRELYVGTSELNNFVFETFNSPTEATIDGENTSNTSGDKAFGIGDTYYQMEMHAGYRDGMVMTFDNKSESLQDTSAGAGYTAEVAFDFRPDRTTDKPTKIRLYPADKSGTVHLGNRIVHLTFITQPDGATKLTVYDRSGSAILGEVNLSDVLGDYTKNPEHFFRIRAVFNPTDASGSLTRSFKLFVDGKLCLGYHICG